MNKRTSSLAAFILLLAVALGAFGAHGLKSVVGSNALANWQTGVTYQFYHGLALLFLSLAEPYISKRSIRVISTSWILGIILFSGSLYLLSLREPFGIQGITSFVGPLTPLGGLAFMVGWAILIVRTFRGGT